MILPKGSHRSGADREKLVSFQTGGISGQEGPKHAPAAPIHTDLYTHTGRNASSEEVLKKKLKKKDI